jgi:oligoribonuclease NrnB/cAMP/cGMP phosphodiesterase (DHH superfamily)
MYKIVFHRVDFDGIVSAAIVYDHLLKNNVDDKDIVFFQVFSNHFHQGIVVQFGDVQHIIFSSKVKEILSIVIQCKRGISEHISFFRQIMIHL